MTFALLLAACGVQPKQQEAVPGSSKTGSTPASATTTSKLPVMQNPNLVFNGDGLHVEAQLDCNQHTVLSSTRLAYDTGQIQAIENYINAGFTQNQNPKLPSSLLEVSGGTTCGAYLQLTNTGSSPVIIDRVGVKLLASAPPNTYQYRLIDICSMLPKGSQEYDYGCVYGHGGGPKCNIYGAAIIKLSDGPTGKGYSTVPVPALDTCPKQLTVAPGPSSEFLNVNFAADNLTFSVAVQLLISTSGGQKTIKLSQSPSTLIFAKASQFSCYALKGSTFTLEFKGSAALTDPNNPNGHNCY